MSSFNRLFNTPNGRIIISILWGVGLALIFFYQVCQGPQCIVFKAPAKGFENDIYSHQGNCYSFMPETIKCDKCPVKITPSKTDNGGKCY